MAVSLKQVIAVGSYVVRQRIAGRKRYPLVLMLEPLFRCNLACGGCGKIQHPIDVLRKHLSPEQCFAAVDDCGAPVVAIPGGEPLLHPQISEIVAGIIARKKFVYLCTNGIRLEQSLDKFIPSEYFSFSVHLDGLREEHDRAVDRKGIFDVAVSAIKAAKARGFRVTTNTTIFNDADPQRVREFFDFATAELKVDGMMIWRRIVTARRSGNSTRAPSSSIFSSAKRTTSARPGACRVTVCSAGRSRAICSAKGTRTRIRSCWTRRSGNATVTAAAIRSARTAWSIPDLKRRRPRTRCVRSTSFARCGECSRNSGFAPRARARDVRGVRIVSRKRARAVE